MKAGVCLLNLYQYHIDLDDYYRTVSCAEPSYIIAALLLL